MPKISLNMFIGFFAMNLPDGRQVTLMNTNIKAICETWCNSWLNRFFKW